MKLGRLSKATAQLALCAGEGQTASQVLIKWVKNQRATSAILTPNMHIFSLHSVGPAAAIVRT